MCVILGLLYGYVSIYGGSFRITLLLCNYPSPREGSRDRVTERSIKKIYQCIVLGEWPHDLKKVKNKLDTKKVDKKEQKTFRSDSGKESLTTFKIEQHFDKFTQLIAMPHTGRTHQIRFHCYDSGYPIIGDRKYSNDMSKTLSKRLMLHAKQIEFQDNGKKIIISTDDDYGLSDFKKST